MRYSTDSQHKNTICALTIMSKNKVKHNNNCNSHEREHTITGKNHLGYRRDRLKAETGINNMLEDNFGGPN